MDIQDVDDYTALMYASEVGDAITVCLLINAGQYILRFLLFVQIKYCFGDMMWNLPFDERKLKMKAGQRC